MDLVLKEFKTSFHQILQQGSKKMFITVARYQAKIFVVGTRLNPEARVSFITRRGSCESSSSEINFFTKSITSPSHLAAREEPWLMLRAKAAGTSAGGSDGFGGLAGHGVVASIFSWGKTIPIYPAENHCETIWNPWCLGAACWEKGGSHFGQLEVHLPVWHPMTVDEISSHAHTLTYGRWPDSWVQSSPECWVCSVHVG